MLAIVDRAGDGSLRFVEEVSKGCRRGRQLLVDIAKRSSGSLLDGENQWRESRFVAG